MKINRILTMTISLGILCGAQATAATHRPQVKSKLIYLTTSIDSYSIPFALFIPENYTPEKKWPLILSLHGRTESVLGGLKKMNAGISRSLEEHPDYFPALIVMPQAPRPMSWEDSVDADNPNSPKLSALALHALELIRESYSTDDDRNYLTGNSQGGFATWSIGSAHPDLFAALLEISGGGVPETMAPHLRDIPIWAFHGTLDQRVPVRRDREMVEAIRADGNTTIRYTEFPYGLHHIWNWVYSNPKVMRWLFSQKRSNS